MKMTILSFKNGMGLLDNYSTDLSNEEISQNVTARLEFLVWGKSTNLFLLFASKDKNFKVSVFHSTGYKPRDKSICFRDEELIGKEFELSLKRGKSGYLDLKSAMIKEG